MKTFEIQSYKSVSKIKYFVLILIITLFSFPAMALLSSDRVEITDDCTLCGVCEENYPNSFFVPDQGKAAILVGYSMAEIKIAETECPSEAIKIL